MHVAGGGADCKVCFVRREYSVVALFMCGHSLHGYAGHGVDTWEPHGGTLQSGGEEGLESIKLLTSFIQQMHEMKPRNVWPKSPNLKMFIFIFSALDVCCSF